MQEWIDQWEEESSDPLSRWITATRDFRWLIDLSGFTLFLRAKIELGTARKSPLFEPYVREHWRLAKEGKDEHAIRQIEKIARVYKVHIHESISPFNGKRS